ncbi:MAG TPA: RNA ligase (ATP), partial [Herpetosiphonaceae bacterium]
SVQRVLGLEPIPNADAIELARINGWQCVVKKGEFAVGDLGVYFEIDAVPPDTPPFQFLWQPKEPAGEPVARPAKFRIRTIKLRGALSQGLLMPPHLFDLPDAAEGDDLTAALDVGKYEPPQPLIGNGEIRGLFPRHVPKTDEIRVQSVPQVLDEIAGLPYVCTLKYDGSSATFCLDPDDGSLHVCSRNFSIREGENTLWRLARELEIEAALRRRPELAIQGEVCGPGIQKNRLDLRRIELFVFSLYDSVARRYLSDGELRAFCQDNGLQAVALADSGPAFGYDLPALLALAEGKYPGTANEREGIVIRPASETVSEALGGRLSFKAISNRFLLKEGD